MSQEPALKDVFTVAEYAKKKGVATNTVYEWIKKGKNGEGQSISTTKIGAITVVYELL